MFAHLMCLHIVLCNELLLTTHYDFQVVCEDLLRILQVACAELETVCVCPFFRHCRTAPHIRGAILCQVGRVLGHETVFPIRKASAPGFFDGREQRIVELCLGGSSR